MIQLSGGHGRILKWLRGMKLRQRVLLSYYLVVLLAVGTLSASVFHIVSSSLMDQNTFSLEQSFQQAGAYLAYRIRNIVSVSDTIMSNYTLNTILNRDIETYSRRQQFLDSTTIRQLIQSFQDGANIYRVHVYVDDRLSYADDGSSIHGLSKAQSAAWWEELNKKRGQIAFVNDWYKTTTPSVNEPMLSMLRIMYRQSDYSKVAFVLQLDIPKATIVKTLQSANFSGDSATFLLDGSGSLVAASDEAMLSRIGLTGGSGAPSFGESNTARQMRWNGRQYVTMNAPVSGTDWKMITLIPYDSFSAGIRQITLMIFSIAAMTMLAAYFLSKLVADTLTKRIYRLCDHMRLNQAGVLTHIEPDGYSDEVGTLYQDYNALISRLQQLLKENDEIGQELVSMEYEALQSQINPHFLYNTLDMINWLALSGRSEELTQVVRSLAKFYKLSLNGGNSIVTIGDELAHVDHYMQIQQIRHAGRIRYLTQVDPVISQYSMPRITLQPIVENAIYHGIMEKPEKSGTIRVTGAPDGQDVLITVEDDGVGFGEEDTIAIREIGQQDVSDLKQGSHYGLSNIDKRIKLRYGGGYGLEVRSVRGEGTRVTVRLPRRHPDDPGPKGAPG
jgi:two-component system sensor histidine kinase YesM